MKALTSAELKKIYKGKRPKSAWEVLLTPPKKG
jgi:hypothetical protein